MEMNINLISLQDNEVNKLIDIRDIWEALGAPQAG